MKVGSYKIKTRKLIIIGIVISIGFILYSVVKSGLRDRYAQDIESYRQQKNIFFKTSEDSPIEDQVGFKELRYFDPNKNYRVVSTLILITDSSYVTISNNDGEKNKYWRYAYAVFTLDGELDTLTLLRKKGLKPEDDSYFLPFYDDTNGDGTYEGGRYIDVKLKPGVSFVLDFNLAYNPYCVYNYRFSCPVPPVENKLERKIEAGERAYLK